MNTEDQRAYGRKGGLIGGLAKNPKKGFGTTGSERAKAASIKGVEARRAKKARQMAEQTAGGNVSQ